MGTALANVDFTQLPTTGSDDDYADVSKSGDFLRSLRLFTGSSDAVTEGLISPGHFGYRDDDSYVDLGAAVDVLPVARRPKAVDFEARLSCYNPDSTEFDRIKSMKTDAQYGVSFLVWVRDVGFFELFFGGTSSRPKARDVFPYLPNTEKGPEPITLRARLIKTEKHTWHVPTVSPCAAPIELGCTEKTLHDEVVKFVLATDDAAPCDPPAGERAR